VPGPEYEWAVFIRPSYVGVSISDWEFAFDNTVDVSVHVPADVTMTSDSGFVPPAGPAADPLPLDHFLTYTTKTTKGSICATDSAANVGNACQVEEDCGGVSEGEDETAFCVPNKFPANVRVALTDMIDTEPKLYDVKKPLSLCVPADKRGEGIVDADTHLRGYAITQTAKRCAAGSPQNAGGACTQEASCGGTRGTTTFCPAQPKFVKQTGINVVNQFHATPIVLDAIKPDRLLIPTSKGVTDPEPPPDPTGVDHYRCYTVAVPRTAPKFTPIPGVAVDDQFTNGAKLFDLKKPTRLCVPTSKNAEAVVNPLKSLLCYQAAPTKGQPKLVPAKGLFLRNQLGVEQADTAKEEEFCVPSDAGVEPGLPT
jgi:hypothetical protein